MSFLEGAVLLAGIFGMPVALLVNSQRFRRLGRRMRGAFWGGLIGYAVGILVWGLATIAPAQMWDPGSVRVAAIVLTLVLFGSAGFALGALVGKQPKHHHRRQTRAATDAREHASSSPGTRLRQRP